MKKVMIIGSRGMAGHTIYRYLDSLKKYELSDIARSKLTWKTLCLDVVKNIDYLKRVITNLEPDIIINCVGILVKASEENYLNALAINQHFPHRLAKFIKNMKTKIIHLSTDCIFDGKKGNYSEIDKPNETNNYGRTKRFGEIKDNKNLTLRLSIIGDELKEGTGLFSWFMRQEGEITGYARAIWNGITCLELAKQIDRIIDIDLIGIYHLAPDFNISKFHLLRKIARIFNKEIVIKGDYRFKQDKTLINNRKKEYDPKILDYETQLIEMKEWIERSKE